MSEIILKTEGLTLRYGHQLVLDNVSICIEKGDIYGFVGENGSGKTTVIRSICGLIFPESGSYELFGIDSKDPNILSARKRMGAIVEAPSIYLSLSAVENLKMHALLLGITDESKIIEALEMVGLGHMLHDSKKAQNFSLGMRQRLGIAMAILSGAEFMVLDEPLNGLDPEGINAIRNLILDLNKNRGITFLISSHILTELSLVATKYGIISHGKLLKEITAEELKNQCEKKIVIETKEKEKCLEALLTIVEKNVIEPTDIGFTLHKDVELKALFRALLDVEIININTETSSLEKFYFSMIKGGKKNG